MKTMLLMLAASLIDSVALTQINADPNDIGLDDFTGQVLQRIAAELRNIASGNPPSNAPSQDQSQDLANAATAPVDRTTD